MIELAVHGIAKGGEGVAREGSGRVVFVRGGLPGDVVEADLVEEKARMARAVVVEVLEPGPGRVSPVCGHVHEGCGGCDLQHASPELQADLKTTIVADALERIGGLAAVDVEWGGSVSTDAYRTTVRCAVVDGRAGFRSFRSDLVVSTPDCTIAHPAVQQVMAETDFGTADEVQIRAGARTGDLNVVVSPDARGIDAAVDVVGADELDAGRELFIHEEADGRRWRVSARSFFQSGPDAIELLTGLVRRELQDVPPGGRLCDLYAGVGIFAGSVGHAGPVTLVESSKSATADAAVNLAHVDHEITRAPVERWTPTPAVSVIADPPRAGLGRRGVQVVAGTGAGTVVLVSCDPAAFARDARLLVDGGYELSAVTALDLFPQTSHVEVVARFVQV